MVIDKESQEALDNGDSTFLLIIFNISYKGTLKTIPVKLRGPLLAQLKRGVVASLNN